MNSRVTVWKLLINVAQIEHTNDAGHSHRQNTPVGVEKRFNATRAKHQSWINIFGLPNIGQH